MNRAALLRALARIIEPGALRNAAAGKLRTLAARNEPSAPPEPEPTINGKVQALLGRDERRRADEAAQAQRNAELLATLEARIAEHERREADIVRRDAELAAEQAMQVAEQERSMAQRLWDARRAGGEQPS